MEIKIMTSNVWADVFGNPVPGRDSNLSTVYLRWMPDILCLQEMHPHWYESLVPTTLKEKGFIESKPDITPNELNYTPLYYLGNKFEMVDEGFHLFTGPNDFSSKSITWALLRDKESGILVGAMATHLYFEENEKGNLARIENCKELFEIAVNLKNSGAKAVFCGGDMNCPYTAEPLMMLQDKGMLSAALLAPSIPEDTATWHDEPIMDENGIFHGKASEYPNSYSLDHILMLGEAECIDYHVVNDTEALAATDHSPVFTAWRV